MTVTTHASMKNKRPRLRAAISRRGLTEFGSGFGGVIFTSEYPLSHKKRLASLTAWARIWSFGPVHRRTFVWFDQFGQDLLLLSQNHHLRRGWNFLFSDSFCFAGDGKIHQQNPQPNRGQAGPRLRTRP